MKRPFVQAVVLIAVAFVLAIVSNAIASRQRRLVLPGYYPSATQVPPRTAAPPSVAPPIPAATATAGEIAGATQTVATTTTKALTTTPHPASGHPLPARGERALPPARFAPHPDKPYVEISGADAKVLHSNGALVLDARRTSVYEQGHIAGARPFSVWESDIDEKVNKLYEERNDPREQLKPILIYCSGGDCEDSHMLAQKLWGVQFNNVYVYKDGFPDWQKRGGPIHTGSNP
ncbi:MAG TPA: rhodanese-like domain-containing protein [Thermoanaerobaculia bacterium]|jgi:rhodanese-related sulfurtransferase|nr:rhodanese-like domain-containing protein [Thermoanaerobaculia bacterium]